MSGHEQRSAVRRLLDLLRVERGDLLALTTYAVATGILTLIVPVAMQAVVNTVAAGVFLQPLIVLSLMVLGGLALAGGLHVAKLAIIERLQQRIFARTAMQIADRLHHVRIQSLRHEYAPELVNRFFDVLTIQKSLAKMLFDGLGAVVQALVGLTLLGVSSPALLALNGAVVVLALLMVFVLGYGGLRSSVQESKCKYAVADWLEDLARCHPSLKVHGGDEHLLRRADDAVIAYIEARKSHFRVTRRQALGHYAFTAAAGAGVLAAGGWLVLNGALTLGQLVAAQIIVTTVLAAMEKVVRQSEDFFDLLTALEKVEHITELEREREGGEPIPLEQGRGLRVAARGVRFRYGDDPVLDGFNLTMEPGDRVSLVGASGAGKSTFASLLCGLEEASHGVLELDGVDLRDADLASVRRQVAIVDDHHEIIDGTIEENITLGRPHVRREDVRWALDVTKLADEVATMRDGVATRIVSGGQNLSRGQVQRVLIARAIVGRPRLLILDEAFTGIDEAMTHRILDEIFSDDQSWTILNIANEGEVVIRTPIVHILEAGRIVESGSAAELSAQTESRFSALFPFLSSQIRVANRPKRRTS